MSKGGGKPKQLNMGFKGFQNTFNKNNQISPGKIPKIPKKTARVPSSARQLPPAETPVIPST